MSKITIDGLTWSMLYSCTHMATVDVKEFKGLDLIHYY